MASARMRQILAGMLLVLAACAAPPVQEMSNARQAIQAAEDAGAQRFAPTLLDEARDLLAAAEQKLRGQSYRGARRDALRARDKALEALHADGGAEDRS